MSANAVSFWREIKYQHYVSKPGSCTCLQYIQFTYLRVYICNSECFFYRFRICRQECFSKLKLRNKRISHKNISLDYKNYQKKKLSDFHYYAQMQYKKCQIQSQGSIMALWLIHKNIPNKIQTQSSNSPKILGQMTMAINQEHFL